MSLDQINSFEGGLNTNSSPERQEKNTYRYMLNGVDTSDSGDLFKITSEKGTVLFSNTTEQGIVIGQTVLNTDIILFIVNGVKGGTGYSCKIGIVDYQGNWTVKVNSVDLGFFQDFPIQAVARINFSANRVVYFVDNLNPIRRVDLDSTAPFDISNSSLLSNITLPIIDFLQFNENKSSKIYTGVYQFVARYLEDDLSPSTFGFITNVIPVVNDLRAVGRDKYDGAPIDTEVNNKTIQLNISNIDSGKKLIEVAYIRYIGAGQTVQIKSFYKGPITGTSMDIEFTGLEDTEDLTLDEITLEPVNYTTAKTITQKDNRLLVANLRSRQEGIIQLVANQIGLSYDVVEEVYDALNPQYYSDYKGEKQTFDKKTYMSEEVYAFALQIIYKDGSKSLAYHIPAVNPDSTWISADNYATTLPISYSPVTSPQGQKWYPPVLQTQTNGVGDKTNLQLGTYVSQLKYESGKDYPSTGINDGSGNVYIRHHLIPPLDIEPHFRHSGSTQYIRYKSVRATQPDFSILDAEFTNDIAGYVILRADRELRNRSIVSQGIIQRTVKMNSVDMSVGASPYPFGDSFYMEAPGFSNFEVDNDGHLDGGSDAGFFASRNFQPDGSDIGNRKYTIELDNFDTELVTYYSPDFILGNIALNPVSLKEKLRISGDVVPSTVTSPTTPHFTTGNFTDANRSLFRLDLFVDYNKNISGRNVKVNTFDSYLYSNPNQDLEQAFSIPFNGGLRKIFESFNTPHYLIRTNTSTLYQDSTKIQLYLSMDNDDPGAQDDDYALTILPPNPVQGTALTTNDKALINLQNNLTQQYGSLGNLEYIPVAIVPDRNTIPTILDGGDDELRIYNGDIFISKFYVKNSSLINVQIFAKEGTPVPPFNSRANHTIDNFPPYFGMPIQSGSYFFVESVVNTNYRHEIPSGLPYYPKSEVITANNTDPKFGHPTGYNLLYSRNNNIKTVPERPTGFVGVSEYPNRIIYSQEAIESEQSDAYRRFLVNNFHDVPKNKGEIWNLFSWNNILYAHCPKTLWRTFMNDTTALQDAQGEAVYLGSGGMFPRPAEEVFTMSGGFAGTISQFAGCATPTGYIFPDILQGNFFKLGQGLEEISAKELSVEFDNNLHYYLDATTKKYIDNPFKPGSKGIMSAFDPRKNRFIFTYHDTTSFTMSYSFNVNKWRSHHIYTPNVLITNDKDLFGINNTLSTVNVYKHNVGEYLKFYADTTPNPFKITFVIQNNGQQFIPDNLLINSLCKDEVNNKFIHQRTFDLIRAYNDNQNTGLIQIITNNAFGATVTRNQVLCTEKNKEYRTTLPKNAVINDSLDIFDSANLVTSLPLTDPARLYRDRLKNKYAIVELTFTPTSIENYKFALNYIASLNRINNF